MTLTPPINPPRDYVVKRIRVENDPVLALQEHIDAVQQKQDREVWHTGAIMVSASYLPALTDPHAPHGSWVIVWELP
jgi:hypothetical protein